MSDLIFPKQLPSHQLTKDGIICNRRDHQLMLTALMRMVPDSSVQMMTHGGHAYFEIFPSTPTDDHYRWFKQRGAEEITCRTGGDPCV